MKRSKRIIAVLMYLFIVSLLLGLRLSELFDLRQFMLVIAGGIILYLPAMEKEDFLKWKKPDLELLARNTIYASYIETFVLLFLLLYHGQEPEWMMGSLSDVLMRNIALNIRPLLYGICVWIALGSEGGKHSNKRIEKNGRMEQGEAAKADRVWTAQECYQHFLELGLTKREAEVAIQICKGLSNKEIALELNISETTVKKHVSNIFEKLDVKKREEIRRMLPF